MNFKKLLFISALLVASVAYHCSITPAGRGTQAGAGGGRQACRGAQAGRGAQARGGRQAGRGKRAPKKAWNITWDKWILLENPKRFDRPDAVAYNIINDRLEWIHPRAPNSKMPAKLFYFKSTYDRQKRAAHTSNGKGPDVEWRWNKDEKAYMRNGHIYDSRKTPSEYIDPSLFAAQEKQRLIKELGLGKKRAKKFEQEEEYQGGGGGREYRPEYSVTPFRPQPSGKSAAESAREAEEIKRESDLREKQQVFQFRSAIVDKIETAFESLPADAANLPAWTSVHDVLSDLISYWKDTGLRQDLIALQLNQIIRMAERAKKKGLDFSVPRPRDVVFHVGDNLTLLQQAQSRQVRIAGVALEKNYPREYNRLLELLTPIAKAAACPAPRAQEAGAGAGDVMPSAPGGSSEIASHPASAKTQATRWTAKHLEIAQLLNGSKGPITSADSVQHIIALVRALKKEGGDLFAKLDDNPRGWTLAQIANAQVSMGKKNYTSFPNWNKLIEELTNP